MSPTADLDACTRVAVEFATKLIHGKYAGAHLLQGYHFHKPQAADDLVRTLGLEGDIRDVA